MKNSTTLSTLFILINLFFISPDSLAFTALTPVKSQMKRNTCSAFAATALLESLFKKKTGKEFDFSEAYLYWSARKNTINNDFLRESYLGDDGLAGFMTVEALKYGIVEEPLWPYEAENWFQKADTRCTKNSEGRYIEECFTGIPPKNLNPLKYEFTPLFLERDKIADFITKNNTAVVFNINWYFDLFDAKGNLTRLPTSAEVSKCENTGQGCGGHVILLVNYDPGTKKFTFKNSWGTGWGNAGYGTIPEQFILEHCEACRHLRHLNTLENDAREFVLKAVKGSTGKLSLK